MILLNPKKHTREYIDEESKEIMLKTIAFFEAKGKGKLKKDDHERVWYSDFLEFQKKEKIFEVISFLMVNIGTASLLIFLLNWLL